MFYQRIGQCLVLTRLSQAHYKDSLIDFGQMRNECGAVSLAKTINNFLLFLNFFVPAWANKKRPTGCGSSGTRLCVSR